MIDLKDAMPYDFLPDVLRKDAAVEAASYAFNTTARKLLSMIDKTSVYAVIDILPEELIDLIALEFRAQYYNTDAPLEEKREAVKKALLWYRKAGTASVVLELAEFLYGKSAVLEWFDYERRPYTFRLEMYEEKRLLDFSEWNSFLNAVKKVKNTRSLLEAVIFHRKMKTSLYSGVTAMSYTRNVIVDFFVEQSQEELREHSTGMTNEAFKMQNIIDFERSVKDVRQTLKSDMVFITKQVQITEEEIYGSV